MKNIKDYEVEGCWTAQERIINGISQTSRCRYCGTLQQIVPQENHFNSKFWKFKRDDGMLLVCCPNGCNIEHANERMNYFMSIYQYCTSDSKSFNYKLDLSKINSCIINKYGFIYPCEYQQHIYASEQYFNKKHEDLEKEGYLFISGMRLSFLIWNNNKRNKITNKQIKSCEDLFNVHNRNLWDKNDIDYKHNKMYLDYFLEFN